MWSFLGGDYYMAMSQGARSLLRRVQMPLMIALLAYKALTRVVVYPVLGGIWSVALRLSPDEYIVPSNLRTMVRSPYAIVAVLLIAFLLSLWSLYEFSLIICGLSYARKGMTCRLAVLLGESWRHMRHALHPRNWLILVLVAFLIPVASVFSDSDLITQISVPYYIYEVIADKWQTAGAYWAFRIVLMLLTLRWLLTVHYFVLERKDFMAATRESAAWLMENPRQALTGLVRWAIRVALWTTIASAVVFLVGGALFVAIGLVDEQAMRVFVAASDIVLEPFWLFVIECVGTLMQQSYISAEYYTRIEGEPLDLAGIEDANRRSRVRGRMLFTFVLIGVVAVNMIYAAILDHVVAVDPDAAIAYGEGITITSHRGYSEAAPENTIPAFEAAIAAGADCAELDVQMTKDGVVVLTHDTNLQRTTGCDANVYDLTYEEVAALDAGSSYSAAFAGTQIPTLDAVIKTCKGRIRLNIEIKSNEHTPTLVAETVRIIEENDFVSECVVTSLSYDTLVAVKAADPDIRTGYIMPIALGSFYDLEAVDFYSMEGTFVTRSVVQQAHLRGQKVSVWTMDRSEDISRVIECDVDDIITDDPVGARDLVDVYRNESDWILIIINLIHKSLQA